MFTFLFHLAIGWRIGRVKSQEPKVTGSSQGKNLIGQNAAFSELAAAKNEIRKNWREKKLAGKKLAGKKIGGKMQFCRNILIPLRIRIPKNGEKVKRGRNRKRKRVCDNEKQRVVEKEGESKVKRLRL